MIGHDCMIRCATLALAADVERIVAFGCRLRRGGSGLGGRA